MATSKPSSTAPGISFCELLAYNHSQATKWKAWFAKNPAAMDVKIGEQIATVRDLVKHIFQAEVYLALRASGQEADKRSLEPANDHELWAMHERGYELLGDLLVRATDSDLSRQIEFQFAGGFKASVRKVITQALLHNVHHWGQIAMELRQAGIPSDGPHDFLLSDAMA